MQALSTTTPDRSTSFDLDAINAELERAEAADIVAWAAERFGDGLVMSTSFGVQSAVMLHLVTRVVPDIPVIFIDTGFHFMDTTDWNQFTLSEDALGRDTGYLVDNLEGIKSLVLEGEVIGIEVPPTVELTIAERDPAVKGNSATARQKNAKLETGLEIQVPEHIAAGETVRVDTSNGNFLGRASK